MSLLARDAADSIVEMTQLVLPGETNALGSAFGGAVMGWIDIAGAVAAQRHCRQKVVTASMDELHFHAPIKLGWIVNLKARVIAAFSSSMEVGVTVHSENPLTGERTLTTSALLTFVALDEQGKKLPVPPLEVGSPQQETAKAEAQTRRTERLANRERGRSWVALLGQE
jgi:acyl-CoA hydrolase